VGIRSKFGNRYLFSEYNYELGPPFGTASPFERLAPYPAAAALELPWERDGDLFDWLDSLEKASPAE
jgi:hypothetical protein